MRTFLHRVLVFPVNEQSSTLCTHVNGRGARIQVVSDKCSSGKSLKQKPTATSAESVQRCTGSSSFVVLSHTRNLFYSSPFFDAKDTRA